ncbi:MAG: hypothetical protein ACI4OD_01770 [Selenomonas sp.]
MAASLAARADARAHLRLQNAHPCCPAASRCCTPALSQDG